MTDHTYAFNSMTHFEYETNIMTGNGNHENIVLLYIRKIVMKIREITSVNLFLAGFSYLEPLRRIIASPRFLPREQT